MANLTSETRRPSLIPLGDGIRPKRNSVCFKYASSETRQKTEENRKKQKHQKKKHERARHPRSLSSQTQKGPKNAIFCFQVGFDFGFVLSEIPIPHYHYLFHHPHQLPPTLQPLYSSFFPISGRDLLFSLDLFRSGVLSQAGFWFFFLYSTFLYFVLAGIYCYWRTALAVN